MAEEKKRSFFSYPYYRSKDWTWGIGLSFIGGIWGSFCLAMLLFPTDGTKALLPYPWTWVIGLSLAIPVAILGFVMRAKEKAAANESSAPEDPPATDSESTGPEDE